MKKYATVRALSVHLSVCLCRYYFSWGWPILPVYDSIESLWPQGMNQGRNFFWTGPGLQSGGLKSKFHTFSYINWILLSSGGQGFTGGGSPRGVTRGSPIHILWSIYTQWSVKIRLPVTSVTASFIFITSEFPNSVWNIFNYFISSFYLLPDLPKHPCWYNIRPYLTKFTFPTIVFNNLKINLCSQLFSITFQGISTFCCFVFWFF